MATRGSSGQQLAQSAVFLYARLEVRHDLGAGRGVALALNELAQRLLQHRLELAAFLASDGSQLAEQARVGLAGKFLADGIYDVMLSIKFYQDKA